MELTARARAVLRGNDRGGYTHPSRTGLYPAQWNWDSCLVAMGFATFDLDRAWREIETLLEGQWADGMVPSILFRGGDESYFPNASVWRAPGPIASSGITQPPVAATAVRRLVERSGKDDPATLRRLQAVAPRLLAWRRWFSRARDPSGMGLVALVHPWESGMDNSPVWDEALAAVPAGAPVQHLRKDLGFSAADERPRGSDYDRYINLVLAYRELGYQPGLIYPAAPLLVADIGVNAILARADADLSHLFTLIGDVASAEEVAGLGRATRAAIERRWREGDGLYYGYDLRRHCDLDRPGVASFLPLYCDETVARRRPALIANLERWLASARYGAPSYDPNRAEFEPRRYWRGPVWLVINWMLVDGLERNGRADLAERIRRDSLSLVGHGGFAEYYDPFTGEGLGGQDFSWTAAMYLVLSEAQRGL